MHTCIYLQTVEEQGGIDIFVSNAGVSPHFGPMLDVSVAYVLFSMRAGMAK